MYTLLLFTVLLTVLLSPAAASGPVMDLTPPISPMDLTYPVEGLLVCHFCAGMQLDFCQCILALMPYNYVAAPEYHDPMNIPPPDTHETEVNLTPVCDYVTGGPRPVSNEYIQRINANETTVQPGTVQAHVDDTYTPGDRLLSRQARSRRRSGRRQPPREGGFVCNEPECTQVFNRQCDLNRHQKTSHRNERPHVCPTCSWGFRYPKDLRRHQLQHQDPSSTMNTFRCEHPDCVNLGGFSRKDNLQRHRRRQHQQQ
ncbi:hypothetical protein COCMIDRAFT_39063 [Bipolaris oryzae ATCC 44560]|uniref:C2H2-type domain-containing protein n=1 Tax=Bipolaris oryzae ATCC 44560 TaxID=930090 RepID=W6YZB4_COCMI|nr:uncharacterized protein COCMIDRAFT_39063 [Bipolaris oryzae ATCC 44560]EUC42950.1 hypothetical protein COCMIDRAFT_39063 [Bipolaris oryzae ATCC 44560]